MRDARGRGLGSRVVGWGLGFGCGDGPWAAGCGVGGWVAELVIDHGLNTKFGLYKFGKYRGNFLVYIQDPRIRSGIPSS